MGRALNFHFTEVSQRVPIRTFAGEPAALSPNMSETLNSSPSCMVKPDISPFALQVPPLLQSS